jgi:AraC-like DNA-binding protein
MLTRFANHDRQKRLKAAYHASRLPGIECCTLVNDGVPCAFLHDRFTVLTLTAGEVAVWYRGERHLLRPGAALVLEPGEVLRDLQQGAYRAVSIVLTLGMPAAGVVEGDLPSRFVGPCELAPTTVALAEAVRAGVELAVQQEHASRLFEAIARCRSLKAPRDEPPLVARARRALLEAQPRAISLEALAGRLRCAPSYLCRVFSEHVGLGPHAYQLQLRLLAAARLLASGESVATAARLNSFSSASHLRRHFLRRFGVAPGEYVVASAAGRARPGTKPTRRRAVELA